QVFEEIFNSPKDELKEAKKILERIISRRIPKCLGEIKPKKFDENMFPEWKKELAKASNSHTDVELKPEDFDILLIEMDYGMKDKNPIDNMYFYNKDNPTRAFKINIEKVFQSKFLPKSFSEKFARVYYKKTDQRSQEAAREHFVTWCKKNKVLQDREVVSEDKRSRRSTI
uniref:deoxynucleoside triphosphate triphosphohydrolase SAMHD1-like n=1 Tax=Monopterus albus TaxID=43700 RepID=UPI0009B3F41F